MSIRDDLTDAFLPWITDDLRTYLQTIGGMFSEVEFLSEDRVTDGDGWSLIMDPDLCPVDRLGWLAQFTGETLPVGLSEVRAREYVKSRPVQRRGTVMSIVSAAQQTLTGQRSVVIRERTTAGGATDADHLVVQTLVVETPDPTVVLQNLRTVVPADIVLSYSSITGQTYSDAQTAYGTYTTMASGGRTYQQVSVTTPGNVFTSPAP